MWHALIDEAMADVATRPLRTRRDARAPSFLELAPRENQQQVKWTTGTNDGGAGKGQRTRDVPIGDYRSGLCVKAGCLLVGSLRRRLLGRRPWGVWLLTAQAFNYDD